MQYSIDGDFNRKIRGTFNYEGRALSGRIKIKKGLEERIDGISGGFIFLDRKVQLYLIERTPDNGYLWAYSLANSKQTGEFAGYAAQLLDREDLFINVKVLWGKEELISRIDDAITNSKLTHTGIATIQTYKPKRPKRKK